MAAKGGKDDGKRPIIIKKIKKGGHGHHGGAWKVAYADFVTAMMAFFLLLWLLSSSSKATLEGLAEYFTPTTGVKDGMGIGFKGGLADAKEGSAKSNLSQPGLVSGRTPQGMIPETDETTPKESEQEANLRKQSAAEIEKKFTQEEALKQYKDNINVRQTAEGLEINVMDSEKFSMFERGSAQLTEHGRTIIAAITPTLKKMPNYMSIAGHTDASPAETGHANYSNWELSADRGQSVRRFLAQEGMEAERPKKVTGMADKELYTPQEPRGPKNRRVAMVMLKGSHILIPDAAVPQGDAPVEVAPAPAAAPVAAPEPAPATPAPAAH